MRMLETLGGVPFVVYDSDHFLNEWVMINDALDEFALECLERQTDTGKEFYGLHKHFFDKPTVVYVHPAVWYMIPERYTNENVTSST